ncbi:MAG TPA: PP2C family protein-serine/threonine phosphatase, partial [Polyangiaceae bacterium]|nr:PP2C family protein-serine/threonine phosphatase [Polyangiaceae bacterium]
ERYSPPGFWLGAVADVAEMTRDQEIQLEDGDLLVLFTDGVTESMNEAREQFGLTRLMKHVERYAQESPSRLCELVLHAVRSWSSSQMDDISLLVARYRSPESTL